VHKKSFPEQERERTHNAVQSNRANVPLNTKKRRIKRNGYSYPVNQSGFVRRLAVSSDRSLILSACSIRSRIADYSVYRSVTDADATGCGCVMEVFHLFFFFAEIAEVYRVFRLAFLTSRPFCAAYIGEHFLNEVAAKRGS
jgi:hypothetical protein